MFPFPLLPSVMANTANSSPGSRLPSPLLLAGAGLSSLATLAYGITCLGLYQYQRKLIFRPLPQVLRTPAEVGITYEDVWIPVSTEGTGTLHGWWLPNPGSERVMLFFHGNYGNVSYNLERIRYHHSLGFSVLAIDYRGYGHSIGTDDNGQVPTEQTTYADAEAAWNFLTRERQVAPECITVCGHSLGGAIAINLATHHPNIGRLIIKSSFTTMEDAIYAKKLYRIFPIKQLLTEPFNSLKKVKRLKVPVLFVHGDQDPDVPPDMSEALYQAAPEPKQLWLAPGADHNNISQLTGDAYAQVVEAFCTNHQLRPKNQLQSV